MHTTITLPEALPSIHTSECERDWCLWVCPEGNVDEGERFLPKQLAEAVAAWKPGLELRCYTTVPTDEWSEGGFDEDHGTPTHYVNPSRYYELRYYTWIEIEVGEWDWSDYEVEDRYFHP